VDQVVQERHREEDRHALLAGGGEQVLAALHAGVHEPQAGRATDEEAPHL